MLPYFSNTTIRKNICATVCIGLAIIIFSCKTQAQSLGDPIVHITFGSGTNQFAGKLAPDSGSTTYSYSTGQSPDDGQYAIVNSTQNLNSGWVYTTDHTGDPGGYMMLVNASFGEGLFYTRPVTGLCGTTTYQFSAWIKNVLKGDGIKPNVTFTIEANGQSLGSGNTGDIIANNTWVQYSFTFSTPVNTPDIVLKMVNNTGGGSGNDIAIDDITFRPYGSLISAVFDQASTTFCEGGPPQQVTIKTTTTLAANYVQKLQQNINGIWVDKSLGSTATSFSFLSPTAAGVYTYRLVSGTTDNISTSTCVVSSNQLQLTVTPLPTAIILVADNTCEGEPTVFKDQSTAPLSTIATWLWDFGDGQTSIEQNPSHVYANPGNPTVKLTVTNSNGCKPSTTTQIIHIIPKINIGFNYTLPDCINRTITLTDVSTAAGSVITSRVWDYGDGTTETKTDNAPFQHTYTTAGSYPVKLVVTTDKGCTATLTQAIIVSPLPVVDFDIPPTCTEDYSTFTDKTTIADNSNNFTYLWDFGDQNATPANPNTSTQKNPKHRFIEAGPYQVTLTVTSVNGCQATSTKTFMVNGSEPNASFEALNPTTLCSDREVVFVNHSTVDIGKITKIIWYFDSNDATIQETDNAPFPGKQYTHVYPEIHLPQPPKPYTVRIEAYSGGTCISSMQTIINLLPTPVLTFNAPESLCLNNGPLQFTAQEGTGIAGSGVYSGTGVSASGLFDPVAAGVGTFLITYTYIGDNTCSHSIARNITVKPIPTVNAGADVSILSGGSTILHAAATGDALTYSWFPVTGLSNSTIPDPVVTLNDSITYRLTVTNSLGCSVSDKVTIFVLQAPVIPNAFTPNNDGINDVWNIKYLDTYPDCTVDVFNRYGKKIYSTIGYSIPWDGRYNGADLPFGVYYYIINPKHGRKLLSGYVTIIR